VPNPESDFLYDLSTGGSHGAGAYVYFYIGTSRNVVVPKTLGGANVVSIDWLGIDIDTLDVSACKAALRYLNCCGGELMSLNVSGCSALEFLDIDYNNLTTLNLTGCTALKALYCRENYFNSKSSIKGINKNQLVDFLFDPQKSDSDPDPEPNPDFISIDEFSDVAIDAWCATYVIWASDNNIVTGYPDNTFRPENTMTRAEFVQVLYNLRGKPAVAAPASFSDVASGDWYFNAVSWAVSTGVASGVGDNKFDPNGSVTREQAVTFLYKFAQQSGENEDYSGTALTFGDEDAISPWATVPVQWSSANGVVGGYPDGTFGPQNTATRAEVVTILYNYVN
jgi:hypothetical protein